MLIIIGWLALVVADVLRLRLDLVCFSVLLLDCAFNSVVFVYLI